MSMKDAYVTKMHAKLDEWSAEIDNLKAKADVAEANVQLEYEQQISELKLKQNEAHKKLLELKNASDGAWEDLKAGVERAWVSVSSAVESATSRFRL